MFRLALLKQQKKQGELVEKIVFIQRTLGALHVPRLRDAEISFETNSSELRVSFDLVRRGLYGANSAPRWVLDEEKKSQWQELNALLVDLAECLRIQAELKGRIRREMRALCLS